MNKKVFTIFFLSFFFAFSTQATTYVVSKTADTADGTCDADCSLREAISAANAHDGDDTIFVPAGTYTLSISGIDEDNNATGDLDVSDSGNSLIINGISASSTIIDANHIDRVIQQYSGSLILNDLSIINGTITGNGGGIFNNTSASLLIHNCYIHSNTVTSTGGGIFFRNDLIIENSLISDNTALISGGGIFNYQSLANGIIINSTINNNSPSAIHLSDNANLTIISSTILNHSQGIFFVSGTINVKNSLFNNTVNCNLNGNTITSLGYNIDSANTCGFSGTGDQHDTDPLLDASGLQDNGGPTNSIALQSSSPAKDRIPPASCTSYDSSPLTVDQRGFTRPENTNCDVGAYELDQTIPVITKTSGTDTIECAKATWVDAGATVSDNQDSIFDSVISAVSSGTVTEETPGIYPIVYTATDNDNNIDTETRNVTVQDTKKPTITVTGETTQTIECSLTYTDQGATATDTCDTSVSVNTNNPVNTSTLGSYTVTYTASDDSLNPATQQTRTINVTDTTKPAITLIGDATQTVNINTTYTDPGATVSDTCDTTLSTVTTTGSVNTAVPGIYTLTYSATDTSSNTISTTRTITVVDVDNDLDTYYSLNDCNDNDNTIHSTQTYYQDLDTDTLGNLNQTTSICSNTAPTGYVTNTLDPDDTNAHKLVSYDSQYTLALNNTGTTLYLLDLTNNQTLKTLTLSKTKTYTQNSLKIKTLRSKKFAVIISKKGKQVLLSLVLINVTKSNLSKKDSEKLTDKNIKPSKTSTKKNNIYLKNSKAKTLYTYLVNKDYKLNFK